MLKSFTYAVFAILAGNESFIADTVVTVIGVDTLAQTHCRRHPLVDIHPLHVFHLFLRPALVQVDNCSGMSRSC